MSQTWPVTAHQAQQTDISRSVFLRRVGDYESRRQAAGFKVSSHCPLQLSSLALSHIGKERPSQTAEVSSRVKTLTVLKDVKEENSTQNSMQVIISDVG